MEGEREYNGGCVYVYTPPIDEKTEEPSCPGGRLVSIHSYNVRALFDFFFVFIIALVLTVYPNQLLKRSPQIIQENHVYIQAALDAGIKGTITTGGQFANGGEALP